MMMMRLFLLNHHSSHSCGESNSPTAASDCSRDTLPPPEVDEKVLTSENVEPGRSNGKPFDRKGENKTVCRQPEITRNSKCYWNRELITHQHQSATNLHKLFAQRTPLHPSLLLLLALLLWFPLGTNTPKS